MSEISINADKKNKRKKILFGFAALLVVAGASTTAYYKLFMDSKVFTDNAYTAVETALITPSVGGTVSGVSVVDTQSVKKGDVLVTIDQTDVKLQISLAEAELERAKAAVSAAESEIQRANTELKRRLALIDSGSVSADELTAAKNAANTAKANLEAANAVVTLSKTKIEQAKVDLDRTVVRSPVDGVVAKRQVQLGQKVQAGTPLLAVVPVGEMHVDANFKEVQLSNVRIGQPVKLHADIYGSVVTYTGVVEGFSGGSGSAFSAIPAQNATGNWIKIVQRLPVRIKLDPAQLKAHPLKVGLSMNAEVDTSGVAK